MKTNFKEILAKFKNGANSMEEVYSELAYLTSNYDEEIEKLQETINDEKTRANDEEYVRHEAEKNLQEYKTLQQINFSVMIDGLIKKPKEEFQKELKSSLKKFIFTIIVISILSVIAIAYSFTNITKNNFTNKTQNNNTEINEIMKKVKKENNELKEFIKNELKNLKVSNQNITIEPINIPEILKNDNTNSINKESINSTTTDKTEIVPPEKKILDILLAYDKKFKLNGKNDFRIVYKMFLLDLAPFRYELVLQELKLFAKRNTYIPKVNDLLIWDKQMLQIYTNMLEKIKDIPESKITIQDRTFHNYKYNDATIYSGWEYIGESKISTKESLKKEIERLQTQITLNSK
jgi:type II secretory pathway pseudopilin PulG